MNAKYIEARLKLAATDSKPVPKPRTKLSKYLRVQALGEHHRKVIKHFELRKQS